LATLPAFRFFSRYHDFHYRRRNRRVWCKTLDEIRPWDDFSELLTVMQTHLHGYMKMEEKHGRSAKEERNSCIASVRERSAGMYHGAVAFWV
jgi:hypothetical protein